MKRSPVTLRFSDYKGSVRAAAFAVLKRKRFRLRLCVIAHANANRNLIRFYCRIRAA
jgi:hypothetical protein